MPTLQELEKAARERVDQDRTPDEQLESRKRFYKRWGSAGILGNFGTAEIDFFQWMIDRGSLRSPTDSARPGSAWWAEVHRDLAYDSTLASFVYEEDLEDQVKEQSVKLWFSFFDDQTPKTWYRAHNGSILRGALRRRDLAYKESKWEIALINIVLYRVGVVQTVAEGTVIDDLLGELIVSPTLPLVHWFVSNPLLYPQQYPATEEDIKKTFVDGIPRWKQDSLPQLLSDVNPLALPPSKLFPLLSRHLGIPEVARIVMNEHQTYPDLRP